MDKINIYTEEMIKIAIQLSRLWGITETLEEIPIRSADVITRILYQWIKEYVESDKESDITKYFLEKKANILNDE